MNPVIGIKNPARAKSALTGNSGRFRDAAGNYIPFIDPNQVAINYLQPGYERHSNFIRLGTVGYLPDRV